MSKLYKNFIFDIVAAVITLALAIIMLPPIGLGLKALNILLALGLVVYMVVYLFDRLRKTKGTLFVLAAVEMALVGVIAVCLALQQFHVFNISGICSTIGVVIWLRSVVSLVGMYLTSPNAKTKYSLPVFSIYLALLSFGMFLYARPFISDLVIAWILSVLLFMVMLVFIGLALLYAPARKK